MKNKRLALFDFCETLVAFQTADAFVDYCREESNYKWACFLEKIRVFLVSIFFFKVLSLFFDGNKIHKKFKLLQLRGLSEYEIENYAKHFYFNKIKPFFIVDLIEELERLKKLRYDIFVVSGGYSVYIKYFCSDFNINQVVGSDILFKNNRCIGVIDGKDCMNLNKITKLFYNIKEDEYDLANSIAYSDSISDLPLLKIVGHSVVVSKNCSQRWARDNFFDEIIWVSK